MPSASVMQALGVDWIALGGLAVGLVVGLAGVVASILTVRETGRQRDADRIETERARRREQAVAALAPVQALLLDTVPADINLRRSRVELQAYLDELDGRWHAVLGPLLVVRISHHDPEVRDLASELIVALADVAKSLGSMIRAVMDGRVGDYDTAREDHEHAATLAEGLRAALLDKQ